MPTTLLLELPLYISIVHIKILLLFCIPGDIMDSYVYICLVIGATLVVVTNPQKVPPGVNPNTYQHQPQQVSQ